MNVVVGLGNPGTKYANTRHNAGFMLVDLLAQRLNLKFNNEPKRHAMVARDAQWLLIKPQTFMNLSGQAAQAVLAFYKFDWRMNGHSLVVAHDDLDLVMGESKLHWAKGPKVHNGLSSMYQHLSTKGFYHCRIGVDARMGDRSIPGSDYVLKPLTIDENTVLQSGIVSGISEIMNLYAQD